MMNYYYYFWLINAAGELFQSPPDGGHDSDDAAGDGRTGVMPFVCHRSHNWSGGGGAGCWQPLLPTKANNNDEATTAAKKGQQR